MPTATGICQKQLLKVIDELEKVKVNEEEIAEFMPDIYRKLEWLSKEDLIKRMVSHEFNRFAEYYRNRAEIEIPTDSRGERAGRGDRKEGGFEKEAGKPLRASTVCSSTWVRRTVSSLAILSVCSTAIHADVLSLDVST